MKVDGRFGAVEADPQRVAAVARRAEGLGYDALWTAEIDHDPFLRLVLAAEHSERIQLGTSIAVAFARSPMTLAQLGYDLQAYSRGRFLLGLGTQVRPHIERRFSMPWSRPAARMRELVLAVRAVWGCWNERTPLDFRGEFFTHTLMTPYFDPGPNPHGNPKVFVAAVGERMTEVAGEVADGLLVHSFTTERYLREVTLPALGRGLARAGRSRADVEVKVSMFLVTGEDEAAMAAGAEEARRQVAFYGSTPAYRGVLERHGWGDLQPELTALSRRGAWDEMSRLIGDDVLAEFALIAEPDEVPKRIATRFAGIADRVSIENPYGGDGARWRRLLAELRAA